MRLAVLFPPIKTVVKTVGVAAAGAAAAVLVIAKLNGGSEYDDSYTLGSGISSRSSSTTEC